MKDAGANHSLLEVETAHLTQIRPTPDLNADTDQSVITRLATKALKTPTSFISLVDPIEEQTFDRSGPVPQGTGIDDIKNSLAAFLCRHVQNTGVPLTIPDGSIHPIVREFSKPISATVRDVPAFLGVPIISDNGPTLGAICVIDSTVRRWTHTDVTLLNDMASGIGRMLGHRDMLNRQSQYIVTLNKRQKTLERRLERFNVMRDRILQTFVEADLTVDQRYDALLRMGRQALRCEFGVIARLSGQRPQPIFGGLHNDFSHGDQMLDLEGSIFHATISEKSVVGQLDRPTPPAPVKRNLVNEPVASFLAAPLIIEGKPDGVVEFSSNKARPSAWTPEDISTINFIATLISGHLDLHSKIAQLKQSETALVSQLLASRQI